MSTKNHRSRGAFTLLELALALIVTLTCVVLIIGVYNTASNEERIFSSEHEASTIVADVLAMTSGQNGYATASNSNLILAGKLPAGWIYVNNGVKYIYDPNSKGIFTVSTN